MTHHQLRALRLAYGLTQETMAERVGLSPRQYKRIEYGQCKLDDTLAKLVRLLFH